MGEIRLDHCCRLCLKEGFSLTNIFSNRSAAGDPLYRILNFIYELKILENDGLPSQICSPCMWKMIEFDACKKNVRSSEAEIRRLLNQSRPRPDEAHNDSLVTEAEVTEIDGANELGIECDTIHFNVPIKEELDIVESEMPIETVMEETVNVNSVRYVGNTNQQVFCEPLRERQAIEAAEHFEEYVGDTDHDFDSTEEEPDEVPTEELEENSNQQVFNQHLRDDKFHVCDVELEEESCEEGTSSQERTNATESDLSQSEALRDKRCVGKSVEGSKEELYSCRYCEKSFKTRRVLREHMNLHGNKYKCSYCGKCFGGSSALKKHCRIHTKETPYKCEVCSKCFIQKGNLNIHMATHSSERHFSCNFCDKKFKNKSKKNKHESLHLT